MRNKQYLEFRELLVLDKKRYSKSKHCLYIFKHFIFWYRLLHYLNKQKGLTIKLIRKFVGIIYMFKMKLYGIQLPPDTVIGGGLKFAHFSGIVFACGSKIGKNCTIHQNVTIGYGFSTKLGGYPTIGDGVVIFAGAVITGNITIGNNAIILANTVVTKDVPSCAVVGGIPARVINTDSSTIFDDYGNRVFRDFLF